MVWSRPEGGPQAAGYRPWSEGPPLMALLQRSWTDYRSLCGVLSYFMSCIPHEGPLSLFWSFFSSLLPLSFCTFPSSLLHLSSFPASTLRRETRARPGRPRSRFGRAAAAASATARGHFKQQTSFNACRVGGGAGGGRAPAHILPC